MKKIILFLVVAFAFSLSAFAQESNHGKRLGAKSIINQKAPELVVEKWLGKKPKTKGKFVLIDFWGPSCEPCKKGIPALNQFSKRFKKNLVVIGISGQSEEKVRAMKGYVIEYYNGVDTKKVMNKELKINFIPHAILIDPKGIVRWEGNPGLAGHELTADVIEKLIKKYGNKKEEGKASKPIEKK